jgi:hypothetical protein
MFLNTYMCFSCYLWCIHLSIYIIDYPIGAQHLADAQRVWVRM